jgi:DNA-binding XRE family transcriptional regulator
MAISGVHVRLLRAAFRMQVRHFAQMVGVDKGTVVNLEAGGTPQAKTAQKIAAAFRDLVEFLEETDERGPGIILKKGWERLLQDGETAEITSRTSESGDLNAMTWNWESELVENDEPLPPLEWTDEDRADQIEHWRSRPEAWAKLHEVSRQCLLQAMGVERL